MGRRVSPDRLARLAVLAEQVAGEVEYPAAGLFVEAVGDHAVAPALAPRLQTELEPFGNALRAGGVSVPQPELGHVSRRHDDERHMEAALDRKSTRLNSSHLGTSYAAFCLK